MALLLLQLVELDYREIVFKATLNRFQSRFLINVYLNYNKDVKMKKLVLTKSLQSKLLIVLLVSFVGLSACNSEIEEPTTNTESSEMTPVQTENDTEDRMTASTEDTEDVGGTAYYSGAGSAEEEQKIDDTVFVNENNSNLDKTAADGVQ